jgi:hypothetical protein
MDEIFDQICDGFKVANNIGLQDYIDIEAFNLLECSGCGRQVEVQKPSTGNIDECDNCDTNKD